MSKKELKTNAMRILDKLKQVYKTLVTTGKKNPSYFKFTYGERADFGKEEIYNRFRWLYN